MLGNENLPTQIIKNRDLFIFAVIFVFDVPLMAWFSILDSSSVLNESSKKLFTQIEFFSLFVFPPPFYGDFPRFSSTRCAMAFDDFSLYASFVVLRSIWEAKFEDFSGMKIVNCQWKSSCLKPTSRAFYLIFSFYCFLAGHGGVNQLGGVFVNGKF